MRTCKEREDAPDNWEVSLQKWRRRVLKEARIVGGMRITERRRKPQMCVVEFCGGNFLSDPSCLYEVLFDPIRSLMLSTLTLHFWMGPDDEEMSETSSSLGHSIGVFIKNNDLPLVSEEKKYVHVMCRLGDTVGELKERALREFNMSDDGCKLWFGTKGVLDPSKRVVDYGIIDGATLNLSWGGLKGGVGNKPEQKGWRRLRRVRRRSRESPFRRRTRQRRDAASHAAAREQESTSDREERQRQDAARQAEAQRQRSAEEEEARRGVRRDQQRERRATESTSDREERQRQDAARQAEAQRQQSAEEQEVRRQVRHDQQQERRRKKAGASSVAIDLSIDDFRDMMRKVESDPEGFFKDSQRSVGKSLLLYYLNSGYEVCDQYREYDANSVDQPVDKEKIISDIQDQKLSDEELHDIIERFYTQHSYTEANLMSCGSCGIRMRERDANPEIKYRKLSLSDPRAKLLNYTKDEMMKYLAMRAGGPVEIPIDANFNLRKVEPWKIVSAYHSKEYGLFHLHPELVDVDPRTGKESSLMCPSCWKALQDKKRSPLSIAGGMDFGYYKRIPELVELNLDEQMILARCRLMLVTLKVKSNSTGHVSRVRDKLLCNAILFQHDAPTAVTGLLSSEEMFDPDGMKELIKMYFVDGEGRIDELFRAAFGRSDLLARAWVASQWITVFARMHSHYQDFVPPEFDDIRNKIEHANQLKRENAQKITDKDSIILEESIGSDVAQSQHAEVVPGGAVPAGTSESDDMHTSMRYTYVMTDPTRHLEDDNLMRFAQLNAMEKAVTPEHERVALKEAARAGKVNSTEESAHVRGETAEEAGENGASAVDEGSDDNVSVSTEDTAYWASYDGFEQFYGHKEEEHVDYESGILHSKRLPGALNEFLGKDLVLTTTFPHVFMLGKAYRRAVGKYSQAQLRHLLHQFTMVPSRDRRLMAYLSECFIRHQAIFGVNSYLKNHPESGDKINKLLKDPVERQRLRDALEDIDGELAEKMTAEYKPYFHFSGRNISYGCMESDKLKVFILETSKRMQAPFTFLTLNMEEANNPRSIRACVRTVSNDKFPAVFEDNCPYGDDGVGFMEHLKHVSEPIGEGLIDFSENARAGLAMDDPVTFVEEMKQMLNDVCALLLGIPPEQFFAQTDSHSRRKTRYFKCNKGVLGCALAYIGVTEDHHKVRLS